jgi:tetratricopeptide (TPR) repeat protein
VIAEKPAGTRYRWALVRPLLWEKIPLFALTVLSSIVTYIVQQQGGAVATFETIPLSVRISNAFVSYITYIGKTIWPDDLAVLYPHPGLLPTWQVVGAAFVLIAVTITVIGKAGRSPYVAVGWLWYIGTLVPVIGIVQVGLQARADRYTYLPLIGLFIMMAWGIPELLKKWRYRKEVLFASSTVILACLCIVTWTQVRYWQNSITLFEHALNVTESNYYAYYHRGTTYANLGNYRQAIEDYNKVIEINPKYREAFNNRGNAYLLLGNYRQAIADYDLAIEINPKDEKAYNNRGNAYLLLGNYRQAIADYDLAIEINPTYMEAYSNRGRANLNLGDYQQAIGDYDKVIEINPQDENAYNNRGNAYWRLGNHRQAIADLKIASKLGHKNAQNFLKSQGIEW